MSLDNPEHVENYIFNFFIHIPWHSDIDSRFDFMFNVLNFVAFYSLVAFQHFEICD
jgi:hypothetical protein